MQRCYSLQHVYVCIWCCHLSSILRLFFLNYILSSLIVLHCHFIGGKAHVVIDTGCWNIICSSYKLICTHPAAEETSHLIRYNQAATLRIENKACMHLTTIIESPQSGCPQYFSLVTWQRMTVQPNIHDLKWMINLKPFLLMKQKHKKWLYKAPSLSECGSIIKEMTLYLLETVAPRVS